MPALDRFHTAVRNALIKDGWTVTHDPIRLILGRRDMYVDLGAERLLAAEKGIVKIAVEVKSFLGRSDLNDLENAVGQFVVYRSALARLEPERTLYLAAPQETVEGILSEEVGELTIQNVDLKIMGYDALSEEIVKWLPQPR